MHVCTIYHRYTFRYSVLYNYSCILLSFREYKHIMRNIQGWSKIRTLVYEENFLWLGLWIDSGFWLILGLGLGFSFSLALRLVFGLWLSL
jgi:hypothetical protein